jgi:hypothetical protein
MKKSPGTLARESSLARVHNAMIARALKRLMNKNSMASPAEKNRLKKLFSPKKKSPVKRSIFSGLFKKK